MFRPLIQRSSLLAVGVGCALAGQVAGQALPETFVLGPTGQTTAITHGFGDTHTRMVGRLTTAPNIDDLVWFDTAHAFPTMRTLALAGTTGGIDNVVWGRSGSLKAFVVRNAVSPQVTVPGLYSMTIEPNFSLPQPVGFFREFGGDLQSPMQQPDSWTLDSIRPGTTPANDEFFLRRRPLNAPLNTPSEVYNLVLSQAGQGLPTPLAVGAPLATGPVAVNPSGRRVAYVSGLNVVHVDIFGAIPIVRTVSITLPAGVTAAIDDLVWIDDRFMACVVSVGSAMFPTAQQIVRIDAFNAGNGNPVPLTIPPVRASKLTVSGDGQWLGFQVERFTPVVETCMAVMRASDAVTTEPGGAYEVTAPTERWSNLRFAAIQQSGNPLVPHLVFQGAAPGQASTFHRPDLERAGSITGRVDAGAAPQTVTWSAQPRANDAAVLLSVSFARASGVMAPGPLLGNASNPVVTVGIATGLTGAPVSIPVPIAAFSGPDLLFKFQPVWLNIPPCPLVTCPSTTVFGDVLELPVF